MCIRDRYKYCGNSGLLLPRISLGLWHNFGSVDDFGVATGMIKYAFGNGVTHFDVANNYGPIPGSAETVSYTHLDVYKRQDLLIHRIG